MRERDRLRVALPLRVLLALRLRLRLRLPLALALAAAGGAYAHVSPAVTARPLTPPSWMKYVRWLTVSASADASALLPHGAAAPAAPAAAGTPASSLPTRHPNGCAHDGQPVPTYSTVLSAVCPHVVTVSVPPSGVVSLSVHTYSSREPG